VNKTTNHGALKYLDSIEFNQNDKESRTSGGTNMLMSQHALRHNLKKEEQAGTTRFKI